MHKFFIKLDIFKFYSFFFPIIEGRPKYLPCLESCIGIKYSKTSFFFSSSVLALKKTEDLSVLIFWPKASSYRRRISINCWHSWLLGLQKNKLSSAKKRWVILGQPLQMDKPLINWFLIALPIREEKPFAQNKNKEIGGLLDEDPSME